MTKNIGPAGLQLVKDFEGYAQELKDGSGSCTAYQEKINGKLDIPTIGYGCTKGVTMGMVWTKAQADAALMRELEGHAKRVDRLVTVELNEHERDSLISFDYNCGGLTSEKGATGVLKAINSGDRAKTVDELKRWTKFGGKECAGLVSRRAAEIALFLKPVGSVAPSFMPQQPIQERRKLTATEKAAGALTAIEVARQSIGSDPIGKAQQAVSKGKEIKAVVQDAGALIPPLPRTPDMFLYGGILAAVASVVFLVMNRRSA